MPRRSRRRPPSHRAAGLVLVALGAVTMASGCSADDEGGPIIGRIDDAIVAVESHYGAPREFIEISATESVVSLIVEIDDGAEQAFWSPDDGLVEPVTVPAVDRPTFRSRAVDFRSDQMFDQLRDELPNSEIVDFAITGAGDGAVVYDARLRSEQGGVLLVLLDRNGRILGAQGE